MNNLSIYNELRKVPEEAKKKISGGRLNGMTDINPMWRIKSLTEKFGICGFGWKIDIVSERLEKGSNDEISAFVKINLFIKVDNEWSEPIPGTGGASFVAKEKNGLYQSDECFKMAFTDAVSVACKLIGMGADVYFEKDRTKYDQQIIEAEKAKIADTKIEDAVKEMEAVTSYVEMVKVWDKYPQFKKDTQFSVACTNAGRKYPKPQNN